MITEEVVTSQDVTSLKTIFSFIQALKEGESKGNGFNKLCGSSQTLQPTKFRDDNPFRDDRLIRNLEIWLVKVINNSQIKVNYQASSLEPLYDTGYVGKVEAKIIDDGTCPLRAQKLPAYLKKF